MAWPMGKGVRPVLSIQLCVREAWLGSLKVLLRTQAVHSTGRIWDHIYLLKGFASAINMNSVKVDGDKNEGGGSSIY